MNAPNLESISAAKARIAEELRHLEEQEAQIRQDEISATHSEIIALLIKVGAELTAKQKVEITEALGVKGANRGVQKAKPKAEVVPKYWLPHTQETWSGRGRTPRSFLAWEGTSAHKEWKAKHPDERFPKYPG